MKVLYDHQAFSMQRYGGVSKCFCELIKSLDDDIDYEILIKYSNNSHLREARLCENLKSGFDYYSFLPGLTFKGKKRFYSTLEKMNLIHSLDNKNLSYSKENINNRKFDIFHPTFFNPYFLNYIGNKPFVLTIHDMMPELFPEYYRADDPQIVWKKILAFKANHIIAVSENTKNDIVRLLKIDPQKISVIYHGGPNVCKKAMPRLVEGPYFLFVGMRFGYKNFEQTLIDFREFYLSHRDYRLICVGMPFEKKEKDFIDYLGLNEAVICAHANDKELASYYAHAEAFVYPSMYEGFGMPILEAYANGCPVILNNASCFPEIAGEAVIYFEYRNGKSSLCDAFNTIFNMNETQRNALVNSGRDRLKLFSWKKSARELASVYNAII